MKQPTTTILALLAFATLVSASHFAHHVHPVHHNHKRAIVTEIDTVIVWDVVTKTIYGNPPASSSSAAAAAAVQAQGYGGGSSEAEVTTSAYQAPASTPTYPAPSSSAAVAPAVAPQAAPYKAPAPQPAPAAPAAPPKAPAPAPAAPASPPANYGSTAPSTGSTKHGDITYYDATGLGRCGTNLSNSDATVAVAVSLFNGMSNNGAGQAAPICGKKVNIYPDGLGGKSVTATVADGCGGCAEDDLDLPTGFFESIMPSKNGEAASAVGRFTGIAWEWAD